MGMQTVYTVCDFASKITISFKPKQSEEMFYTQAVYIGNRRCHFSFFSTGHYI